MFDRLICRCLAPLIVVAVAGALLVSIPTASGHALIEARLHVGTCADLGSTVAKLGEFSYVASLLGTPSATPAGPYGTEGAATANVAVRLRVTIDSSLSDLVGQPHAVVVRLAEETGPQGILTCGDVGGVAVGGDLVFGLASVRADTTGIAWLHDAGNETTEVRLFISQGLSSSPTPAASPAAARVSTVSA